MVSQPQFLLFCDAQSSESLSGSPSAQVFGRWHFVLDRLDGKEQLEAADSEASIHPDRLALLSVVRGLEALEQPSHVNLVTTSRYVSRGLKYGLSSWRESDYQWERFGVQKPVRNADLWQRVDQALKFHGVTCRLIQSQSSASIPLPTATPAATPQEAAAVGTAYVDGRVWEDSGAAPTAVRQDEAPLSRSSWLTRYMGRGPSFHLDWWELAAAWCKWWRHRLDRPALLGT